MNAEDEAAVQNLLERQQGAWNMALVMDTLILSMLLPLLLVEELEAPDGDLLNPDVAATMIWASNSLVGLAFYITCLHIALCSLFYLVTSYLTDTLDILWFFATFYRWITIINVALIPICLSIMAVAAIGNVLLYGLNRAIVVFALFGVTLLLILVLMVVVFSRMKARFRASHRYRAATIAGDAAFPDLPPPPVSMDAAGSSTKSLGVAVNANV